MENENATFYCFKGWSTSRKWYATGRGMLSKRVFDVHTTEERLARVLKDNNGNWPGLSGSGDSYFRIVVADEAVDHGWPLMFDPTREGVYTPQMQEK